MNSRVAIVLLLSAICGTMVSCEMPWREKVPRAIPLRFPAIAPSDGTPGRPKQMGRILMVNREGKFVVIDCGGWVLPEAGLALKSFRDGAETGVLIVCSERKGVHVIADIATGSPRKGDQVLR